MKTNDKVLAARVKGVNRAHDYANKLYARLVPTFKPMVGTKIFKVDGTLLQKIKEQLPELPCTPGLHVHKNSSDYSLSFSVRTSEDVNGLAYYHSVSVYIGDVRNGVLEKIANPHEFRTDFTVEEIAEKRTKYNLAKQAYDNAKSALFPFGEYDR